MITNLRTDFVYSGLSITRNGVVLVASGQDLGDYVTCRNTLIKLVEDADLMANPNQSKTSYLVEQNPTIGYGFDFRTFDGDANDIINALQGAGLTLSQPQETAIRTFDSVKGLADSDSQYLSARSNLLASGIAVNDAQATALLNLVAP